jgi:hypothetical protein
VVAVVVLAADARAFARIAVGDTPFHDDFHYYYEASRRFLADPTSLYIESAKVDLMGFLYPPPCIALFVPFSLPSLGTAVWMFRALSLAALCGSLLLLARILEAKGSAVGPRERVLLGLIAFSVGPTYANTLWGQVNTLVLLCCLAFRWLLDRGRPFSAGVVLALGVWLKVYPVVGLIWIVCWERRSSDVRRAVAGFAGGMVAVLLMCAPFVPWSLYRIYTFEILPLTAGKTFQNVLNQSLLGSIARSDGPVWRYLDWDYCLLPVVPSIPARVANACFAAACFVGLGLWSRSEPFRRTVAYLCLLALIPVVSPLGWSYVYVMALPALLVALVRVPPRAVVPSVVLVCVCLAYFVPESHVIGPAARLPELLQHLLYSRYAVAAVATCGVLVWPRTTGALQTEP